MEAEEVPAYVDHRLLKRGTIEDRLYQRSITASCKHGNTLVILPTALGKTVISLMVAVERLDQYPWGKVLVLAPTVPLVDQHRRSFTQFLNSDVPVEAVGMLTGRIPQAVRRIVWDASRVVFATPQTVRNDLRTGRYDLSNCVLVVFDEAHRARASYAYTEIARRYIETCSDPRVLGLTASPGSTRERIQDLCDALSIETIEFRSDEDEDVAPYIQSIEKRYHHVDLPRHYEHLADLIRSLLDDVIVRLRRLDVLGPPRGKDGRVTKGEILELGRKLQARLAAGETGPVYWQLGLQATAMSLMHALEVLTTQDITVLVRFLGEVGRKTSKTAQRLCQDPRFKELVALAKRWEHIPHPKLGALAGLVEQELANEPASRIIVFAQFRDTVDRIVEALADVPGARAIRFVGQASREGSAGLSQNEQAERIQQFAAGEHNVLVATSIAEEGLDIPAVNRVVFYEPIPSEIRLIQRRGRTGRKHSGAVDILLSRGTVDVAYAWASQGRERRMKGIVSRLYGELDLKLERSPISEPPGWTVRERDARFRLKSGTRPSARDAPSGPADALREEPEQVGPAMNRVVHWVMIHLHRNGGEVGLDELIAAAEGKGIPEGVLSKAVERLSVEGMVYRPSPDRIAML